MGVIVGPDTLGLEMLSRYLKDQQLTLVRTTYRIRE